MEKIRFSQKLKTLRKQKGVTLKIAARDAGIPFYTWVAIEYERSFDAKVSTLLKLARYFDLKIDDLIADTQLSD